MQNKSVLIDKALIEFAIAQNDELFTKLKKRTYFIVGAGLCSLFMVGVYWFLGTKLNIDVPFIERSDGTYQQMQPIINPPLSVIHAQNTAEKYASKLLSLHFRRMQEQALNIRPLFVSEEAFQTFVSHLNESGTVETVLNDSLVVTATSVKSGMLIGEGWEGQDYIYTIKVPMIQTTENLSGRPESRNFSLIITLKQVNRIENVDGLLIKRTGVTEK